MKPSYIILSDFKSRKIYERAIFYSAADGYKDAKIIKRSADNIQHRWVEDVIEFTNQETKLKTEVILTLYNYPKILNKNSLPEHSLCITFIGKEIGATRRRLEQITGISID